MQAEELLRQGELAQALESLQEQVRKDPSNAKYRVFLFQLLSVLGQWDRAITQLNVAAEMDPLNLPMAQMCRTALNAEALRAEIFAGKRSPVIFGQPDQWVSWMVQANQLLAQGQTAGAQQLWDRALEAAPAVSGTLNGHPFAWIADADPRTGPILEAVINGRYYWVPLVRVHEVMIEPPADLRDLVWIPAQIKWTNGGESVALIPTRYPGSHASDDNQIRMARKTQWVHPSGGADGEGGVVIGLGQRILATDEDDFPLLEARSIVFDNEVEDAAAHAPEEESADG